MASPHLLVRLYGSRDPETSRLTWEKRDTMVTWKRNHPETFGHPRLQGMEVMMRCLAGEWQGTL